VVSLVLLYSTARTGYGHETVLVVVLHNTRSAHHHQAVECSGMQLQDLIVAVSVVVYSVADIEEAFEFDLRPADMVQSLR
jgi:hypothetical protein